MNPKLRNVIAVVVGIAAGSVLNMGIISAGGKIIPPPSGFDLSTMEGMKAVMPHMEPKHFLMPFLAHALGTLLAAFVTTKLAVSGHLRLAMICGVWFMFAGTVMTLLLPSPTWFNITDLALAYIPMAYLGARLAREKRLREN